MENKFYKSYAFWCSLLAFVYILGSSLGIINILPQTYNAIVLSGLSVLVVAGFITNPQDGNGYKNNN